MQKISRILGRMGQEILVGENQHEPKGSRCTRMGT